MVRFVVAPDRHVVPDVAATLPGRGLWVGARRENVDRARKLFARHVAGGDAIVDGDLADRVERLLARRVMNLLGLARRARHIAIGREQVRITLHSGRGAVLFAARDGAPDSRARLAALAGHHDVPSWDVLDACETGSALGRDHVVHAMITDTRIGADIIREAGRLAGFRSGASHLAKPPRGAD